MAVTLALLTGFALLVSLTALAVASVALKQSAVRREQWAERSDVRKLEADMEDVFDRIKRLASRKGMRARREELEATSPTAMMPGESPEEWKQRMRAGLRSGKVKLSHDGGA